MAPSERWRHGPTSLPALHDIMIHSAAKSDASPWPVAIERTVSSLAALPFLSDRLMLLELLGEEGIGPLQYIDDITVPCPCAEAVAAVLAPHPDSACSKYCSRVKAQMNYEPNKTAAMALLDSPPLDEQLQDVGIVTSYRLLGVLVDSALTFEPALREVSAKSIGMLQQLLQVGQSNGFSMPLVASQVVVRLEPFVLFSCAILILSPSSRDFAQQAPAILG